MVIVGVPPLELGVLSALQDELLALEVGVIVADEGSALHTDGVHPGHTHTHTHTHNISLATFRLAQLVLALLCVGQCSGRLSSPVHEATVLEVITVSPDLQLPASEAFTLVEGDLKKEKNG